VLPAGKALPTAAGLTLISLSGSRHESFLDTCTWLLYFTLDALETGQSVRRRFEVVDVFSVLTVGGAENRWEMPY
jgi:hypothetical protein